MSDPAQRIARYLATRPGELIAYRRLAEVAEISEEKVRELARRESSSSQEGPAGWRKAGGWSKLLTVYRHADGLRLGRKSDFDRLAPRPDIDPSELEQAVSREDFVQADRLMSDARAKPLKAVAGAPPLCWADDTPLSRGAQTWYLTNALRKTPLLSAKQCVARPATLLVDPGLSTKSCVKLARWLVRQKMPGTAKLTVPSGKSEVVDVLGELRRKKELKRPLSAIRGLVGDAVDVSLAFTEARMVEPPSVSAVSGTAATVRWLHVLGEDLRVQFNNLLPRTRDALVEAHWPRADDPSGTAEEWTAMMRDIVERAIRDGRQMSAAHLRRAYLDNPLAAGLISETRLVASERDLSMKEALALPPDARVSFAQGKTYELLPLPDLPSAPISYRYLLRRLKAAGFRPYIETDGGTLHATLDANRFRVVVHHEGVGAGYGGIHPVEIVRCDVFVPASKPALSVRAKLGRSPDGRTVAEGFDAIPDELRWHVTSALRAVLVDD